MTAMPFDDGSEISHGRWLLGGLFALVAHGGIAATALNWQVTPPPAEPPAAIMIELAPLPVAPQETPSEIPPGPKMVEAPPPPPPIPDPEPLPEKVEEPPPPPPEVKPKVVLFKPPPKPRPPDPKPPPEPVVRKPEPPKPDPTPKKAAPKTTAPPTAPAPKAQVAAAPLEGRSTMPPADVLRAWQSILLAHLERHKRYPSSAQARRQQGVAYVRFVMDRKGNVLSAALARTSGHSVLDTESRELIKRAEPLPTPPPDMPQARIELVVPVQFYIR